MATKPLPSQEVLRQLLDYDPETGLLTWRERDASWFTDGKKQTAKDFATRWNSAYSGKPALNSQNNGYRIGTLLGRRYQSHRVIWKLIYGTDPQAIDHINGDGSDNRISNLRSVSHEQNMRNTKRRVDNTTGFVGVERYQGTRWVVKLSNKHIGLFDCIGQAIKARRDAERKHGFHENHGRAA